jgi:hypothetical protein
LEALNIWYPFHGNARIIAGKIQGNQKLKVISQRKTGSEDELKRTN